MPERARRKPARAPQAARARRPDDLLAVDIGNSDIVVGRFHGEALAGFWRLTSGRATADEAFLTLASLLDGAPARGAVLCSVVPSLTLPWLEALQRATRHRVLEVNATTAASLPIRVHDPASVGADRIANAIAARALHGTPAIVVDLGTATTFDCVSRDGAYLGGAIAPGVGTSAEELFRRAARVARVELRTPDHALGRNTEESLRAGVVWGAAGLVDALVRRLSREMGGAPRVVATGGWAAAVAPECETVHAVDEGLTLKGMRILWRERT